MVSFYPDAVVPRSSLSKTLKRSLLLKILSKTTPTKEDLDSILELTATKIIDDLKAQSVTLYLIENDQITFKYIYYSPTLWEKQPELEQKFKQIKLKVNFNSQNSTRNRPRWKSYSDRRKQYFQ